MEKFSTIPTNISPIKWRYLDFSPKQSTISTKNKNMFCGKEGFVHNKYGKTPLISEKVMEDKE